MMQTTITCRCSTFLRLNQCVRRITQRAKIFPRKEWVRSGGRGRKGEVKVMIDGIKQFLCFLCRHDFGCRWNRFNFRHWTLKKHTEEFVISSLSWLFGTFLVFCDVVSSSVETRIINWEIAEELFEKVIWYFSKQILYNLRCFSQAFRSSLLYLGAWSSFYLQTSF